MTTLTLLIETLNRPQLDALIERVTGEARGKSNSKAAAVKALHRVMGAQMMQPDEVVAVASDMGLTDYAAATAEPAEECWPDDPSQDEAYFAHCERMEAEHAGEPEDLHEPPVPAPVANATPKALPLRARLVDLALRPEGLTHEEARAVSGWQKCWVYVKESVAKAGYTVRVERRGRIAVIHADA